MNKLNMLRKKNKGNLISIGVLCFLMVVAVTLSTTLAFFSDKGTLEGIKPVNFGTVVLDTPTNGFEYSLDIDFTKLYPGSNFEVTGGIKSLSTGDFYIYMEPKMGLQKLVGDTWIDLGDIYMGEQDNNYDWHETSTKAFTFHDVDIVGTLSKTGTQKLFSTYSTNATDIGWGEQTEVRLTEDGLERANGLYSVNAADAATFANDGAPTNNAGYEHTLVMTCSVEFDFDTPNVVFYTTDDTNYTELVLNDPTNENNFRFNFSIEFRAMQQANMIGEDGNLDNVFSADESWSEPNHVADGTIDLKDVYDFLRIKPLFSGEYKQWTVADSGGKQYWDFDAETGIITPNSADDPGNNKANCKALTDFYIPGYFMSSGRYVQVEKLANSAFYGCSNLTNMVIPDSMVDIGQEAFEYCSGLTGTLRIPDSVRTIGESAFFYTNFSGIIIGKSVTSIGQGAFTDCRVLTSISVESGNSNYSSSGNCLIETVTKTLIQGCNTSVIPSDDSVTNIGTKAFYSCSNLTIITIPISVISIGTNAFSGCSGLTSATIGSNVTSIGIEAFHFCSGLTNITIPTSVTSIGRYAFEYCSNLSSITFENTVGWKANGTDVVVTNPTTNATYLKTTYYSSDWTRT